MTGSSDRYWHANCFLSGQFVSASVGRVQVIINRAVRAGLLGIALIGSCVAARADALDDIMKAKVIKVAVPQDFAPFGSAGPDLKPVGYDIDMANLIAQGARREGRDHPGHQRQPHSLSADQEGDLVISSLGKNPEREKVIDFSDAYAPFFSGVYGTKDVAVGKLEDLAGKTVGATRGAIEEQEISKIAPSSTTVKRYEDNNATISAFISGQVDLIATGNMVAAAIAEKIQGAPAGAEVRDQGQPLLYRPEQGRAEADGQGQRDHRQGESVRRTERDLAEMAEGGPAGGLCERAPAVTRHGLHARLRRSSALLGRAAARTDLHDRPDHRLDHRRHRARHRRRLGAHLRPALARLADRRLCRGDPQHAVHRAAVLHLLRAAGGRASSCRRRSRRSSP